MNNVERAKQFLPFDSLKGLREELKKREEKTVYLTKPVLSEEKIAELSEQINCADMTKEHTIMYYSMGKRIEVTGVFKINYAKKTFLLADNKIPFNDILFFI